MIHDSTPLCLGSPRFDFAAHQDMQRDRGPAAAWQQALAGNIVTALQAVHGDFAVGIDLPDGRQVLAVDRFAIQSICYRVQEGRLRYAARADQLADAGHALDRQAIFDYMYFHTIASPRTAFDGVMRLPPGHVVVFDGRRLEITRYWQPHFARAGAPADFATLARTFRETLKQSVAAQLDGGKPACFLSGGTDSSTVAGMIREACGSPAATYSIGFEAEGYDEMAFARIAARHFGAEHHEYYVTPDDLVRSMPEVAASYDQPFGNSSVLPAYYCARMARQDGVTRLLAGDGGDELFGGNSRYAKQRLFGMYRALPAPLRSGLVEHLLLHTPMGRLPLARKAASYVEQARVPMPDRLQIYNLLLRLGIGAVLTSGFLASVDPQVPLHHQQEVWASYPASAELDTTLAFDWRYTLAETDLPKVMGATRLAGVAAGFPMLERALVDFSLSLPADYKLKGSQLRWFFKEALRGFLPDEIIAKKKQGFGLPFGVWLTRHVALRHMAGEALGSFATRGVVRPDFIRRLFDQHLGEHPGYYGEMVWILTMLEFWLQHHAPAYRFEA
jgi:asparagine synthase (glutamine-hydrolysing)